MTELAMAAVAFAALVLLFFAAAAVVVTTDWLDDPLDLPQTHFGDRLPTAVISAVLFAATGGCTYGLASLAA